MVKQLLLCKRLLTEGASFAERSESVASGMAISLFQDSVEMYVWALIKDRGISVKEGAPFTANLETIQRANITLSHTAKLLELNKARVGFKHYGNLPAPDEAVKFQAYVEDFLRTSFSDHFFLNFDELSLVDLVSLPEVKERLKSAEALAAAGEYEKSALEAAIAKAMLFSRLDGYIPHVDRNLGDLDSLLNHLPQVHGVRCFQYLSEYLEMLRESSLASLLRLPLQDYTFVRVSLPSAYRTMSGVWRYGAVRSRYDAKTCKRAIGCLVDISIRMESLL